MTAEKQDSYHAQPGLRKFLHTDQAIDFSDDPGLLSNFADYRIGG